jgi:hypothetical protein
MIISNSNRYMVQRIEPIYPVKNDKKESDFNNNREKSDDEENGKNKSFQSILKRKMDIKV